MANASAEAQARDAAIQPVFGMTVDDNGLAWLVFDLAESTGQVPLAAELEGHLGRMEQDHTLRAVVLTSRAPACFVAGADVARVSAVKTARDGETLSRAAQHAMDRLAALDLPVVCAIRGAWLGGSLELALACRARVAADDDGTRLGFPEVTLGLIPGAGGTQRLPRLVGIANALELVVSGEPIDSSRAKTLGLVDAVCPPERVRETAAQLALELSGDRHDYRPPRTPLVAELFELVLENNPAGRALLFGAARRKIRRQTGDHYPAPLAAVEAIQIGIERGLDAGHRAEAERFGILSVDRVAKSQMSLFVAQAALEKPLGAGVPGAPREVHRIAVLGGGLMGSGIAYAAAAEAEAQVRVKDKDDAGVARGLAHVRGILDERVADRSLSVLAAQRTMERISGTTDYAGLGRADLVIEAVYEDLGLKQKILEDVESITRPTCVFASNTATIPITRLAQASSRPETVCGMHFFSPAHKTPLVELIVTPKTAPWATATAARAGRQMGKIVIVVKDGPGFYTPRALAPYLNEAAYLVGEGIPIEFIDRALCEWGFAVGPLTLLDDLGIDVATKAAKVVHEHFGSRMAAPLLFGKLIEDGRAGRRNQKGLYTYGPGKKRPDATVYALLGVRPKKQIPPLGEIAERVALQMVNEAVRCLEDGVLSGPRDGDVGAVFGLGFPRFRGGPFRYVDTQGAGELVDRLDRLSARYGARFEPAPLLRAQAKSRKKFLPT
jgi:3-hydroxyacyl-CoA dehydrogenase/enoyl-CoA hydratase/3-hydroxybutyryl-CoA epimerase